MIKVATELHVDGGLLVGHDGSRAATEAVQYAARLARRLGCKLHVLRTWTISTAPRPASAEPIAGHKTPRPGEIRAFDCTWGGALAGLPAELRRVPRAQLPVHFPGAFWRTGNGGEGGCRTF